MTIPDYQIPKHLPDNSDARIQVVFLDTGRDAFVTHPAAIRAMCRCHMLNGEINKHGYLKYVRLLASVREARRISRATERTTAQPRHAVTHFRQPRGAKRWEWRPDNAQCGRMGGVQSIFI